MSGIPLPAGTERDRMPASEDLAAADDTRPRFAGRHRVRKSQAATREQGQARQDVRQIYRAT